MSENNFKVEPTAEQINVSSIKTPEELESIVKEIESEVEIEGKLMEGTEEALTNEEKPKELTDEEKKAIYIQQLKESHIRFKPIKHELTKTVVVGTEPTFFGRKRVIKSKSTQTNVTTNQFDADYRKKRKNKNRMARASRKANR